MVYKLYFDDKPTESFTNAFDTLRHLTYYLLDSGYELLAFGRPNDNLNEYYFIKIKEFY